MKIYTNELGHMTNMALAEEEQELEALVESLEKTCTRYKMEISAHVW